MGPHPLEGNQMCFAARSQNSQIEEKGCEQPRRILPETVPGSSVAPGEFLSGMQRRDWPFFSGNITACITFTVLFAPLIERIRAE